MPTVTVFRGPKHKGFDGAEEISDYEFPAVPRVGETVSIFDNDRATFEKVVEVNYHAANDGILVRVLVEPEPARGMQRMKIGGI